MKYLCYKKEDFERVISSLEKVEKYINGNYLVVGGLTIRTLFPEFAKTRDKKLNDLDLVFYPAKEKEILLKPEVKDEFYITHIYSENFGERSGFYFAIVDKENFVKIDLFMPERDIITQEIRINNKNYRCPIKEDIYLNNLRDFWYWTNAKMDIDSKQVELLEFLETKGDLNSKLIEKLWASEQDAIKIFCGKVSKKKFDSIKEYRKAIEEKLIHNQDLIKPKQHRGYKKYPLDCVKAGELTIEDKKTFEMIKEKWEELDFRCC